MKKSNKTKLYLQSTLLASAVAAPVVAVMASTGGANAAETSAAQTRAISSYQSAALQPVFTADEVLNYVVERLQEVRADVTAPSSNYAFLNVPALPGEIVQVEYFSGTNLSLEEAQLSTEWQAALPRVVSSNPIERVLYARVTYHDEFLSIPSTVRYVNLTETSSIRVVKMHFADTAYDYALRNFLMFSGNVKADGSQTLLLNEPVLTSAVKLFYRLNYGSRLLTKAELLSDLNARRATLTKADFEKINAVVVVRNTNRFYDEPLVYKVDYSYVKLA